MNSKQHNVLKAIYSEPTKSNIKWTDIETMMLSLGAKVKEGKGSAEVFVFKNRIFPFHRHILKRKLKNIKYKI